MGGVFHPFACATPRAGRTARNGGRFAPAAQIRNNGGLPPWIQIVILWHATVSTLTLGVYFLDKRAAVRGAHRIPEARLHALALLGGWPGALLAMRLFKHKRRKAAFVRVFWLTVVGHLAAVSAAVYLVIS